jgi:predicted transcriptional regulator
MAVADRQELLYQLDQLEAIAAIEKGLEESKQGKGVPAREFLEKMRKKYKIQTESTLPE